MKYSYYILLVNNIVYINYSFKYNFYNISENDYLNYSNEFKGTTWNLKNESIKYCEIDCISLYQIVSKFSNMIFELFQINFHKYSTLSSVAFAFYRTSFMSNNEIPPAPPAPPIPLTEYGIPEEIKLDKPKSLLESIKKGMKLKPTETVVKDNTPKGTEINAEASSSKVTLDTNKEDNTWSLSKQFNKMRKAVSGSDDEYDPTENVWDDASHVSDTKIKN